MSAGMSRKGVLQFGHVKDNCDNQRLTDISHNHTLFMAIVLTRLELEEPVSLLELDPLAERFMQTP